MKEILHTDTAPAAIGPYSQGTAFGQLVFTSGQIPLDPKTGEVVGGGIEEQSRRAMENLVAVLAAGGAKPTNVLKTTCFLADMGDFAKFNAVYAEYFGENSPARSCVAVKTLPKNVLVEVEAVAVRG
ncbi:RidA family protein [Paludibacterium purpuratum]|uniref:Reactive intermediate/imine deaminase n=1 Tax=Paludibacterium purpuratum TaxID=1144873 RepID=A0A4R7AYH3_9NEIS|nr:RidA family protein [Paludibacterium purpuratum]TDR72501.1 reactive intermediate/imine deaminase [Paludibacterium purpuratum]